MASLKRTLVHSDAAAKKLEFTVPSTVQRNVCRVDDKGDAYVTKICNSYAQIAKSFDRVISLCDKALSGKGIASAKVKSELQDAKKKAKNRITACGDRKKEIRTDYDLTLDIFNMINNK